MMQRMIHQFQGFRLDKIWDAWRVLLDVSKKLILPANKDQLAQLAHIINSRLAAPLAQVTMISKRLQRTKAIPLTNPTLIALVGLHMPLPDLSNVPYQDDFPPSLDADEDCTLTTGSALTDEEVQEVGLHAQNRFAASATPSQTTSFSSKRSAVANDADTYRRSDNVPTTALRPFNRVSFAHGCRPLNGQQTRIHGLQSAATWSRLRTTSTVLASHLKRSSQSTSRPLRTSTPASKCL
ncbi:hypothetical protein BCR44DRAFT_325196 [Catenaria anguillulae PL171]|uniref:Uncharacterized protein n=1 Tax=Catenaria anguillulae PL171 TaxID=765915 RepID=A0A1Y2H620_9FUNG|nr:hypothetical protein BCR44DRAFT_325196 [Catenaria anguillulae PL171]